jgi:hypothetical protein
MGQPLNSPYNAIRQQNPQLLPTFDPISTAASDSIEHQPIDIYLAGHPRTASTTPGIVTIGGTVATGHTITLNVANNVFPSTTSFPQKVTVAITYLTTGSDTASTVAANLAANFNANATLNQFGFYATADEAAGAVNIWQQSGVGAFTTLTGSSTGAETVTITQAMAGGSGPIIPVWNFEFTYNKSLLYFYKGQPDIIGFDLLTALVNQGYPIY